jgi:hypothetical protein
MFKVGAKVQAVFPARGRHAEEIVYGVVVPRPSYMTPDPTATVTSVRIVGDGIRHYRSDLLTQVKTFPNGINSELVTVLPPVLSKPRKRGRKAR